MVSGIPPIIGPGVGGGLRWNCAHDNAPVCGKDVRKPRVRQQLTNILKGFCLDFSMFSAISGEIVGAK
jgi:hypothetical protein